MKLHKQGFLGLGVILLVAVTALANKITTDYDHKADFTKYKTFSWLKQPQTNDPLMKGRIVEFVNAELQRRGLQLVPAAGDLGLSAHAATKQEQTLDVFYNGYPDWGWRWRGGFGGGPEVATVETYTVGTLVVDLFDSGTKQVVWRGVATDTVSDKPEKNTKETQKVVEEMFKKYPVKAMK
jgi:Domain of unknown function (DUF4136)